ncbi:MAG: hypothetical protein HOY78_38945 [Saccharothrix sp.]|nr:hypothetical protein [Saccharothrix sp.]
MPGPPPAVDDDHPVRRPGEVHPLTVPLDVRCGQAGVHQRQQQRARGR